MHQGALAFSGAADDVEGIRSAFSQLELELPWVYEVHAALRRKGVVAGAQMPRNRAELLALLG